MKKCLAIFIGVALTVSASAQILSRTFFQVGGTVGLDFTQFSGIVDRGERIVHKQVNFATVALGGRINVFEFSNTLSVSLAAQPLLSLGKSYNDKASGGTNFMFRAPCTIDVNFGNAATSKSRAKMGLVLGAGVQWVKYPLYGDVTIFESSTSSVTTLNSINMNNNWWEPVFQLGIRNAAKHHYSREVNIRAAYVNRSSMQLGNINHAIKDFQRFSIMLSYLMFLNH